MGSSDITSLVVAQTMEDAGLVAAGRLATRPLTGETSLGAGTGPSHAEATSAPATATAPKIHLTRPEMGTLPPGPAHGRSRPARPRSSGQPSHRAAKFYARQSRRPIIRFLPGLLVACRPCHELAGIHGPGGRLTWSTTPAEHGRKLFRGIREAMDASEARQRVDRSPDAGRPVSRSHGLQVAAPAGAARPSSVHR